MALRDPEEIATETLVVPEGLTGLLSVFDGRHSVQQIVAMLATSTGSIVPTDFVTSIINTLDKNFLLDTPRFRARGRSGLMSFWLTQQSRQHMLVPPIQTILPN
ncbi:MAG: hypothetical protein QGH20_05065 [Candidatus Latescibacteria bacterium]|nr:hypothetical protein [Candidatus Latescibacterota bacterium]